MIYNHLKIEKIFAAAPIGAAANPYNIQILLKNCISQAKFSKISAAAPIGATANPYNIQILLKNCIFQAKFSKISAAAPIGAAAPSKLRKISTLRPWPNFF